jgi:hypothetical protein
MSAFTCPDGHPSTAGDYCDVCGAPIAGGAAGAAAVSPSGAAAPAPGGSLDLGPSGAGGAAPPPLPAGRVCPNCSADNLPSALYCEDCGYDFTTGQLPRPLDPPLGVTAAPDTGQIGLPTLSDAGAGSPPPPGAVDPNAGGGAGATSSAVTGAVLSPPITPTSSPGHVEWVAEVWIDPDWYASQDVADPCPSPGMPQVIPVLERTVLIGRTSTSRNIHPQIDVTADNGVSRRHAQLNSDGQRWWVEDLQSANGTYVGAAGAVLPTVPIPTGQRTELADDDRIYLGAWTRVVVRRATAEESTLGG